VPTEVSAESATDALAAAVEDVNGGDYDSARQTLHTLSLATPAPLRPFFEGLVMVAIASTHLQRGEQPAMLRMLRSASERLASFEPDFLGLDVAALLQSVSTAREHALSLGARRFRDFDAALAPCVAVMSEGEARARSAAGSHLAYREWGDAGACIVLVHPPGHASYMWRPVASRLSADYRVLAPDLPGHGASTLSDASAAAVLGALKDWAEAAAAEAVAVVGVGPGAWLAADLAAALGSRALILAPGQPTGLPDATAARERRRVWGTRYAMFEAYRPREPFSSWRPDLLWWYVEKGTTVMEDGRVRIRCDPELEAALLEQARPLGGLETALEPSPLTAPTEAARRIHDHLTASQ
jgi:pimeloyl-ACP methyl ester carboxylesterase